MSKTASILETMGPQIAGYWARLAGWQRRLLLIAIGTLALALAWAFAPKPTAYIVLFGGKRFQQHQLNRFETALAKAELADYEIVDGQLRVPRDSRTKYLTALDEGAAVPHALGDRTSRELSQINPFESAEQRRSRVQDARRREVAEIIRSLKGIDEAFVQYSESTKNRFSKERILAAIVAVRPVSGRTLNPQLINSVRKIVCSAQSGLQPGDVTIVDLSSGRTFADTDSKLAATDEYLFVKQTFERFFAAKLQRHLGYVSGLRVSANVELRRDEQVDLVAGAPENHWTPQSVSASLAVPESYLVQVMRRQSADAPRKPSELRQLVLDELRGSAQAVLPQQPTVVTPPSVSVAVFEDQVALPPPKVGWVSALRSPLGIGTGCGFALLACALLWGMWKDARQLRRRAPVQPMPAAPPATSSDRPLRVHDRLTELVRENPKVAADAITEWVRKAG